MVTNRKLTIETLAKPGARKLAELLITEAAGNRRLKQTLNLATSTQDGPAALGAILRRRLVTLATSRSMLPHRGPRCQGDWRSAMSLHPKNEAEITHWNSAGGRRWVERQQSQDIVLGPILQATLERAQVRQGERVVDIGRGTGASSIALAERIGSSGQVLGVDVSTPMLARAAERLPLAPQSNSYAPTRRPTGSNQPLLISFFPALASCFSRSRARAFANLRSALKPSGRLVFACWRKFDENPWIQVPMRAALEHVPPVPRPGPEDPGPFSFANEQRVHRILADAGFQSVVLEPRDFDLDIACGGGIEEALEAAMALGPTSRALQDQGPETRAAVATSIRRALQPNQRGKQVTLAGAIWLVTANNA
jgi:SAM-dependent methyltransferase